MLDQAKEYLRKLVDLHNKKLVAIGYQKLSVTGTVATLTIPSEASYAEFKLESADSGIAARYLICGGSTGTPAVADGISLSTLDVFDVNGRENLRNFKIIRVQSGTTTLHVQYFK